ncbi:MAG: [protein-PII] uridylyltransferase [Verrucomicrobia bacterium]|nr:[protein-PII] uridylyltransferase [Verrucomicrobiota bacterium]
MPTLREKIEASAAERLTLPPGRKPSEELTRYKGFLKIETNRLRILHRAGAGGLEVCRARALVLDELIRHIVRAAQNALAGSPDPAPRALALVAYGGYGRGELNPCSDVDIMFLHDGGLVAGGKAAPYLAAIMDAVLYTFWDLGLKVGSTVRSVDDCVDVANGDMQTKTSLIEARLVVGDEPLFKRMQAVLVAKTVRGHEDEYIALRIADQDTRRSKHGDSACMQEPNLKNGCGGLRDIQNLIWMAFFKYRCRSLAEIEQRGAITRPERRDLEAAYDYLLRVRNELHYLTGKAVDMLSRTHQAAVAFNLGYTDRSTSTRIEAFMRDLYTHFRNAYLITRNAEQRLALLPQNKNLLPSFRDLLPLRRAPEQTVDGFKLANGLIEAASPRVFRDAPRRLMRVFLIAQQRGLALHPDLAQMIRNSLPQVDRTFLRDDHVHETFLEILNQRGNVARILRAMHEVDLLGKYLPEFGKLTCLVQHEFYHQYAADEHTLVCLEKLDAVWAAEKPPGLRYAELLQNLPRPNVLYLALLLHDTGKALHTGHHEDAGGNIAQNVGKRLGLDSSTIHALRLLIENHLVMAQTSQRRDLDDKSIIRTFAELMQTRDHLDMLTLHSYADAQGTSNTLWNGFKDSLLWELHAKTADYLAGGTAFIRAEEKQRELLAEEVRRLVPKTFQAEELDAHFHGLPPRYFAVHTAPEIAADLSRSHLFMHHQITEEDKSLVPVVTWHNEPDRGYALVHLCTWDRAGLFSKIAGSLTAAGLNILSADIFSRTDGIILDTFSVVDAHTGTVPERAERERFEKIVSAALTGEADLGELIARRKSAAPLYQAMDLERIPTSIRFDNATSEANTIIDLETEDRVGLLYGVSVALAELGVDIVLAKISTEKGAAVDTFYVTEEEGGKIVAHERLHHIQARLRSALAALEPKK